jgi:glycine cleavage system H protein
VTDPPGETIAYRRSRFATHLPVDRRYTRAHYWLLEDSPGIWRVGFTKFGTRLLGDLVEFGFGVAPGAPVTLAQDIGWVEGFKAVTSLSCVVDGQFLGAGDEVREDITLVETDPYGRGWLYRVRGRADPASVDAHGYVSILDAAVDTLLRRRCAGGDWDDES